IRDGRRTAATELRPGDARHTWPAHAPGGFVYIAIGTDGRRVIRFVHEGTVYDLGSTDGHAVVAGSIVLHVRGGALLAQRLDVESGVLTGRATPLVTPAGTLDGRALVAASPRLLL